MVERWVSYLARNTLWVAVFGLCFGCTGPVLTSPLGENAGSGGDPQPNEDAGGEDAAPDETATEVVIGVPGGEDDLEFIPLQPGDEVQLQTFGQGGTHAIVAVRCIGFGSSAFVEVTIENLETGAVVVAKTPQTRPRPLICREENVCDLLPFLVMTSGLTEADEDKNGLRVEIRAEVRNEAGLTGTGSQQAVLRTDEL